MRWEERIKLTQSWRLSLSSSPIFLIQVFCGVVGWVGSCNHHIQHTTTIIPLAPVSTTTLVQIKDSHRQENGQLQMETYRYTDNLRTSTSSPSSSPPSSCFVSGQLWPFQVGHHNQMSFFEAFEGDQLVEKVCQLMTSTRWLMMFLSSPTLTISSWSTSNELLGSIWRWPTYHLTKKNRTHSNTAKWPTDNHTTS